MNALAVPPAQDRELRTLEAGILKSKNPVNHVSKSETCSRWLLPNREADQDQSAFVSATAGYR